MAILERLVVVGDIPSFTVLALILATVTRTAPQTIQSIGFNLSNVTNEGTDPSRYVLGSNVFLLENKVQVPGILFAFSVYFRSTDPVTLQIYRPMDATRNTYMLIAQFVITPSVDKGREDIYIESLLSRRCIAVRPEDRLAVYVPKDPPSSQLQFTTNNNKVTLYKAPRPLSIGDNITYPTEFPVAFRIEGFLVTSNESSSSSSSTQSSSDTDCIFGLTIPGGYGQPPATTTIEPITGAVGATGATGPVGYIGFTGNQGMPGLNGNNGLGGMVGSTGRTGAIGATGSRGAAGIKGPQGSTGPIGNTGPSDRGDTGVVGPRGPPGRLGSNYTVFLNRPPLPNQGQLLDTRDPFWSSSKAIWASFIWLAIVSFLLLVDVVVVIIIVALHSSIWRPSRRSSGLRTHSKSNIVDEAPSNYSDVASQY